MLFLYIGGPSWRTKQLKYVQFYMIQGQQQFNRVIASLEHVVITDLPSSPMYNFGNDSTSMYKKFADKKEEYNCRTRFLIVISFDHFVQHNAFFLLLLLFFL